jgi:hypothetical protein
MYRRHKVLDIIYFKMTFEALIKLSHVNNMNLPSFVSSFHCFLRSDNTMARLTMPLH